MIQAGRNGIIFHSCHAAFPFSHLSLSFGCAISFSNKQPFVKSSVRFSEKQGFFLFPFCPLFFLPDGNMAVPRYPVPPFVATSLIFPSAVPQPVVSSVFCFCPLQQLLHDLWLPDGIERIRVLVHILKGTFCCFVHSCTVTFRPISSASIT